MTHSHRPLLPDRIYPENLPPELPKPRHALMVSTSAPVAMVQTIYQLDEPENFRAALRRANVYAFMLARALMRIRDDLDEETLELAQSLNAAAEAAQWLADANDEELLTALSVAMSPAPSGEIEYLAVVRALGPGATEDDARAFYNTTPHPVIHSALQRRDQVSARLAELLLRIRSELTPSTHYLCESALVPPP